MKVLIWLTAGAWEAAVDASRHYIPAVATSPGGELILLHVLDDDVFAGRSTRFVVDHALCPVLLVWPRAA
ncbi:hypothetical protein [Sanguibacter gelidistatuariae]|uniref:hypothetical protein n=1 Tax=Sanguibacter gelidistatuariae TaxID=1814289 RepID=UPI000B843352|nr:hypothetical protein [Sanguibacter gelidistatuariae]